MGDFKGLKKDEMEKLRRAVRTHEHLTGEHVDIGAIPEADDEKDQQAEQEKAQRELDRKAKVDRELERAHQEARKAERDKHKGDGDVQDENPGPGQPAMVTEAAKAQGASRKGDEPASAGGKK